MEVLSEELILALLEHLDPIDLFRAGAVCRQWCRIGCDSRMWRAKYEERFGGIDFTAMPESLRNEKHPFVRRGRISLLGASQFWQPPKSLTRWSDSVDDRAMGYRPSPREGYEILDSMGYIRHNPKVVDDKEVLPEHEDGEALQQMKNKKKAEALKEQYAAEMDWRCAFMRNHTQMDIWNNESEPGVVKGNVVRYLVAGMRNSGKTTFLRNLLTKHVKSRKEGCCTSPSLIVDEGANVCRIQVDESNAAIIAEIRRPINWHGKAKFHGQTVGCIVFVVDASEYATFSGDGRRENQKAYEKMIATYKRFHGIIGEARAALLCAAVLANSKGEEHKNLATNRSKSKAEIKRDSIKDIVSRKLRLPALAVCGWYWGASAKCFALDAKSGDSCGQCLAEVHGFAADVRSQNANYLDE